MEYRDKSTGATTRLQESQHHFLVLTKPDDSEAALAVFSQKAFQVTASTNRDGVFVLRAHSDLESVQQTGSVIERLRADPRVREVSPGFVDAEGLVRFALPGRVVVQFVNAPAKWIEEYIESLGATIVT